MTVTLGYFPGAVSKFLDSVEYATATHVSIVTYMNDPFEAFVGNRVEADEATAENLEEHELFFLRTLHVNNVFRVVVRLGVLVPWVDECKVHCVSTSVLIEPSRYSASFLDGVFVFRVPDAKELLSVAFSEDLLRGEVRMYRISRASLCVALIYTGSTILHFGMIF